MKVPIFVAMMGSVLTFSSSVLSMHRVAILASHMQQIPEKVKEDLVLAAVKDEQSSFGYNDILFGFELIKPEDVNKKDLHGCTPLAYAVYVKNEKWIKMLKEAGGTYTEEMLTIIKAQEKWLQWVFSR